jgi:hypothetical protein
VLPCSSDGDSHNALLLITQRCENKRGRILTTAKLGIRAFQMGKSLNQWGLASWLKFRPRLIAGVDVQIAKHYGGSGIG